MNKSIKKKNKKHRIDRRSLIGLAILALSFILLIPGLLKPMITLTGSVKILVVKKQIFHETRSILQTISNLLESRNYFVAVLIFFFSVMVPFIKGFLLLFAYSSRKVRKRERIYNFIRKISKWAMADVFVMGIFVAFLAAKATKYMDATIEPGFYFFTAYCLLSILSLEFFKSTQRQRKRRPARTKATVKASTTVADQGSNKVHLTVKSVDPILDS